MMVGGRGTSIFHIYSFVASSAEGASCVEDIGLGSGLTGAFKRCVLMRPQGGVRALFESCLGFHRGYGSSVEGGMALSEHPGATLITLSSAFTHHVSTPDSPQVNMCTEVQVLTPRTRRSYMRLLLLLYFRTRMDAGSVDSSNEEISYDDVLLHGI